MFSPVLKFDITIPQKTKPKIYVPTDADIKKLLDGVAGTDWELPILLAAFGSFRRGELCALESSDIVGNCIEVNKSIVKVSAGKWIVKQPKNYSSYRIVEMPDFVIDKTKGIEGRLVSITATQISNKFSHLLKKLGLQLFRFHDLRHYQASILHALGVPDKYIMERGGWKTDVTLKTVYQHTLTDRSKQFSEIANKHFSNLYATQNATDKNKNPL